MERHKDYFEGTLQIRDASEELVDWVCNKIRKDGKANIAKIKKVRGGVDLYLSDQRYLRGFGKKLKQQFPGIMKISKRLHTTDKMTSKFVYRATVLFRPMHCKKGDVVKLHGESYVILSLTDKAHIKNIKSGKKEIINLEKLMR